MSQKRLLKVGMIHFTIQGNPVPQKQTRFVRSTGIAYNPSDSDLKSIQTQIKAFAPQNPILTAIKVRLAFLLKIPESCSNRQKYLMSTGIIRHVKKPDVDNLAYLVTNAMKNIIYKDDSQIVELVCFKKYALNPCTIVQIWESNEFEDELCD